MGPVTETAPDRGTLTDPPESVPPGSVPAPDRQLSSGRRRGQVVAAVGAQGIQAAASFALQIYAVRSLGVGEYGAFTVLISLLIVLSAFQAGLRDGGIVLSDDDPGMAPTLATAQWIGALLAGAIGMLAAALLGILDTAGVLLFGAMVVLWVLEEAVRRALMSGMRFDKVAINDLVYALFSVGGAVVLISSGAMEGLNAFVAAMALGAFASVSFGLLFQVSASILKPARPDRVRLKRLGSFAVWRSWQGLVRPLSVFATRVGVGAISGDVALGRLEAGRLLVAPFAVVANGLGTFLLPFYLRQRGLDNAAWRRAVLRPAALLLVFGAAGGAVLVALAQPLSELLTGGAAAPTAVVAGWVTYTVLDGASTPLGVAAISLGHTRRVASARTVGAVIGTVLALVLATQNVWLVPWALCLGIIIGTIMLTGVALSGRSVLEGRMVHAVEPSP